MCALFGPFLESTDQPPGAIHTSSHQFQLEKLFLCVTVLRKRLLGDSTGMVHVCRCEKVYIRCLGTRVCEGGHARYSTLPKGIVPEVSVFSGTELLEEGAYPSFSLIAVPPPAASLAVASSSVA